MNGMRRLYPAGPRVATIDQLPDYRDSPDFFVGHIGLLEMWRLAKIIKFNRLVSFIETLSLVRIAGTTKNGLYKTVH